MMREDAICDRRDRVAVTSVTEVSDESVVTKNLKNQKREERTSSGREEVLLG